MPRFPCSRDVFRDPEPQSRLHPTLFWASRQVYLAGELFSKSGNSTRGPPPRHLVLFNVKNDRGSILKGVILQENVPSLTVHEEHSTFYLMKNFSEKVEKES